jgi:cytochrome c oxidase assembly protein subunit 15
MLAAARATAVLCAWIDAISDTHSGVPEYFTDSEAMDLTPILRLSLLAAVIALLPLTWVWLRQRGAGVHMHLAALTALTMFLTFDLIVFGSFTRLSDSGLGCPDWPGCYGHASPLGAATHIDAAQTAMPSGPVTFSKAWIEMIHRYLAMTVGALILVATLGSWIWRRSLPQSPWWPTATLVWVIVQGLFGMLTVTWKLNPAIVTLHLLGGMFLLALLVVQHEALRGRSLRWPRAVRRLLLAVLALLVAQIALGAWVSSNYAVLACSGFPQCNDSWWPAMDFGHGFTVQRDLGKAGDGSFLPFEALVAIHMTHRLFALLASVGLLVLARVLWSRLGQRRAATALLVLTLWQVASGLSNVVLGWPLAAALAHTAGAAALVAVLSSLLARAAWLKPAS